MNLKRRVKRLNADIERPENWTIFSKGKKYHPQNKEFVDHFKYDNLLVVAGVEFHGFGQVYKTVSPPGS